jgi:DNA polymerase-3 subunit gamma/tau
VKIDDRALGYIVKASEGSMRDAQSLLDQIISFSGQEVVDEDVRDILGFIPSEILEQTVNALAARDAREMLETVGIVVDQGLNLQQYVREFIGKIRDLLVMKLGLEEKILGSPEEKRAMASRAASFSEQDLIRYFDLLLQLETEMRSTTQARFQLEIGFIKLAKIAHVRDIEEVIRELKGTPGSSGSSGNPSPVAVPSSPTRQQAKPVSAAPVQEPPKIPIAAPEPAKPSSDFAGVFIQRVEDKSAATAIHLQRAERIERSEDGVVVTVANSTTMAMLESKDHKAVLDAVASEVVGKAISVSLIMNQPSRPGANLESAKNEPLVRRFLEVFRGDLAQVKPVKGEQP